MFAHVRLGTPHEVFNDAAERRQIVRPRRDEKTMRNTKRVPKCQQDLRTYARACASVYASARV